MCWDMLLKGKKNIVFLGEAGCGKTELAVNLALHLARKGENVHFFDMDQTKPLFRSRDLKDSLTEAGIWMHYELQQADAPTMVGGVAACLLQEDHCVIMDVGGGDVGAKLIGGFSHLLTREDCVLFFVINPFRPWSDCIAAIDHSLTDVLRAARVQNVRYLANPNLGEDTDLKEYMDGLAAVTAMLSPHARIEAAAVPHWLYRQVHACTSLPLIPLTPMIRYPWQ